MSDSSNYSIVFSNDSTMSVSQNCRKISYEMWTVPSQLRYRQTLNLIEHIIDNTYAI